MKYTAEIKLEVNVENAPARVGEVKNAGTSANAPAKERASGGEAALAKRRRV